MNDSTNIPLTRTETPRQTETRWKNIQLRVPKELHQRMDERLAAFNQRTGMNLSFATLIVQTLEEYGMAQLERAEKVYEKYRRRKDPSSSDHGTSMAPPILRQ